jgi:outer membrane protein
MRYPLLVVLSFAALAPLGAQGRDTTAGPTLSLEDAVTLARRSNPTHQQTVNNRRAAGAALRAAYGSLLPSADVSFGSTYREGGQAIFNGELLGASGDIMSSSYSLGVDYRINAATFMEPRVAAANLDAVEADITGSAEALRALVVQRYLTVLQSQANAELQDTLVATAQVQLQLAQARAAAGAATQLDVRRAEVALGQARVGALRARNQIEIDKLRLFQEMGVQQPANVQLTSDFTLAPPTFTLDNVLQMARGANPTLNASRFRERAATVRTRAARSEYSPTLSISTGWGGYTQQFTDDAFPIEQARAGTLQERASCFFRDTIRRGVGLTGIEAECQAINFTSADEATIRRSNSQYPFDFQKNPWSLSAFISIPIFDGLRREQRIEEAFAARSDARQNVRARELALTADVSAAYLTLTTAQQTVVLQTENAAKAREELAFAEERYRVGATTFLDVTEARSSYERAESERITAVYDYHKAFAALENAVGRPLR